MPKLSVITAIYNVESYLRQCLDSLVSQTMRDLEFVLVDDGSPDNCGAICDEYAARDARIKIIHKENGGLSSAWNCALEHAAGDWITFCDPDDWVDTDYYEKLFDAMGEENVDIFFSGGNYIETQEGQQVIRAFARPFEAHTPEQMVPLQVQALVSNKEGKQKYRDFGVVWDKLYRTQFIRDNALQFPITEVAKCAWLDAVFTFEAVCKAKHVRGCTYFGYHYRIVSGSANRKYNPNLPSAYVDFVHNISEIYNSGGGHWEIEQAISAKTIYAITSALKGSLFHPQNQDDPHTVTVKFDKMRNDPLMQAAIHSADNTYLSPKMIGLKYVLRLPWSWPVRMYFLLNTKRKKRNTG